MVKIIPLIILALTACSSMANEENQPITIETHDMSGNKIVGAKCQAKNDFAEHPFLSGESVSVHRSGEDLNIVCTKDNYPLAVGRVSASMNSSIAGNVLGLGWIGVAIDRSSGKAYSYPDAVALTFGQTKHIND
jgi:hypothetical protein